MATSWNEDETAHISPEVAEEQESADLSSEGATVPANQQVHKLSRSLPIFLLIQVK